MIKNNQQEKSSTDAFLETVRILREDDLLKAISFNLQTNNISVRDNGSSLPWRQIKPGWNETDFASLRLYLKQKYDISVRYLKDALLAVAAERSYHPVKEYLRSMPNWDGVKRVDELLIKYLGAEDNSYVRSVTRKTLVAAVARVFSPGVKFDTAMVLFGKQGIGKSTFIKKLAGDWYSDSLSITDMRDKTAAEKIKNFWIVELSELSGLKKIEIEVVKSFLSRSVDDYRACYGSVVESHPRTAIIIGTTNLSNFLRDVSGNRRFWPVNVSGESVLKPWNITNEDVEQIWAESVWYYNNNETLFIEDAEVAKYAYEAQTKAIEYDDRAGLVREYLERCIPLSWETMTLVERRDFLNCKRILGDIQLKPKTRTCNLEIWSECFGREPSEMKRTDSYEIATIMRSMTGWSDSPSEKTVMFPLYGKQRAYYREEESYNV